jgi:quaternary ammonium compound-resistance protein SugE
MNYIYLILAFILNASGNILLKVGAAKGIYFNVFPLGSFLKQNIFLISGFIFFVLNALFYFLALKNIPVSLAYPVMVTASLILTGSYAFLMGGEVFTYNHIIGYALMTLGVVIIFMNTK